jgi:hypothetical protein
VTPTRSRPVCETPKSGRRADHRCTPDASEATVESKEAHRLPGKCGDKFVDEISPGGEFIAVIKISNPEGQKRTDGRTGYVETTQ